MKQLACSILIAFTPLIAADKGWTSLFNGKDMTGWKPNENVQTWSVKDGAIVAHGPRSHNFYVGDFHNHTFRDFELKVDVMTLPGSNGGVAPNETPASLHPCKTPTLNADVYVV